MTFRQVSRSLHEGYTIAILEADHGQPAARRGSRYRSLRAFERELEQVRTTLQGQPGAAVRWCLETDDRAFRYEGRLALGLRRVDAASSMARHANLVLARRAVVPAAELTAAESHLYAAAILTATRLGASVVPATSHTAVRELAIALMQTSFAPAPRRGGLRVLVAKA
jgi:hypothetical protein